MDILCIDSENEFLQSLRNKGHTVHSGELGYRSGKLYIDTPPHEVDVICFNLEKPACFDMLKWGRGNDNYNCIIESSPSDEILIMDGKYNEPRYQLIFDRHIKETDSPFRAVDIIKAITNGRIPLLMFLNDAYLKHVGHRYGNEPNFFDVYLEYTRTKATKFIWNEDIISIFPELLEGNINIKIPIKYKFESNSSSLDIDFVYNNIGDVFSKIVWHKGGLIWLLPEFYQNDVALTYILQGLDHLKRFVFNIVITGQRSPSPKPKSVIIGNNDHGMPNKSDIKIGNDRKSTTWDFFICHAHEDKIAVAQPICNALREMGFSVWLDELILKVGDSLRRKIEEGLTKSKYGLVILSPEFFAKKWPQDELDGLFALEQDGKKRILPIWYNIDEPEVRKFSPLMAGKIAAKYNEGLGAVLEKILDAISD